MEDHQIIEQFLNRDQAALAQAEQQYGDACRAVVGRILGDDRAVEEVVREALLRAWETIPPKQPKNLETYLLRIARNLSVDHGPRNGEYNGVLRELERCVPGQSDDSDASLPAKELRRAIDQFLDGLAPAKRQMFVLRYWYLYSVEEIALQRGSSPDRVRGALNQIRTQLQEFLLRQELSSLSAARFLRLFGNIRDRWVLEAMETKQSLPLWIKGVAVGATICCAVALGAFLMSRQSPPEETQPPQSSAEAPVPSNTSPIASTTEPTVESTAQPTETEEPVRTKPSIRDSAAYQKLLSLKNADQFDASVLEAFAQWIEDEEGFLEAYPEKWELKELTNGTIGLTCFSSLSEDYKRNFYSIRYDGESVSFKSSGERAYTSVPREEVTAKVYGAENPIGVPDELKEAFIDFIMDSDWFAWSTLSPEYERTEWYFAQEPLGSGTGDQTEYITLFVKVWGPDDAENDYDLCSLYYNGAAVMDGIRG